MKTNWTELLITRPLAADQMEANNPNKVVAMLPVGKDRTHNEEHQDVPREEVCRD